jgi:hypothetical protein
VFDEIGTFVGYPRHRPRHHGAEARGRAARARAWRRTLPRPRPGNAAEGLKNALRVVCEIEGWDAGRCFRLEDGEPRLAEGFSRASRATSTLLRNSRVLWQSGKTVCRNDVARGRFRSCRATRGREARRFATFAIPGGPRTAAPSPSSPSPGIRLASPTRASSTPRPPSAALFGQFLQRCGAEDSLRESEARFRSLTQLLERLLLGSGRPAPPVEHRARPALCGGAGGLRRARQDAVEMASTSPDEAAWKVHKQMV